jgi:hypothetical protein
MALKMTGFTPETQRRLLYDAGIVYLNYGTAGVKILGCTRGGNSASIEEEIRKMDFDGTPGDVKGDKRRVKVSAKLTVNLLEFSTDGILANLPGAENTPSGTHDVITRVDQISAGDYFDNVTLVLQKAGTSAVFGFKLKNAIALGNFELGANDEDEAVNAIEFTAHYDPTDLDEEPWEIFNPLEDALTWYTLTYIAGANGSVIGNTVQTVEGGEDGTAVYAHPNELYEFVNWSDTSTDNPRQDTSVAGNITVTANFALI